MFSTSNTANVKASKPKTTLNLVELFKPNKGCTDLMYTESGDISQDTPLQNKIHETHQDVNDLNRELHSTINEREHIIPRNTLLPSITKLFRKDKNENQFGQNDFNLDIDGEQIPHFAVCL